MSFSIVPNSNNSKTGLIPVTYSDKNSCPDTCELKGSGCYGEGGHVNIHWEKISTGERGINYADFLYEVKHIKPRILWRHNVTGDLQGDGITINYAKLQQLIKANGRSKGFTYTHYQLNMQNIAAIRASNQAGFTVNASLDRAADAVKVLKRFNIPTVSMIPEDAPKVQHLDGVRVIKCPADKKKGIFCSNCELCQKPDRDYVIGLPVHGNRKNLAIKIMEQS